MRKFLESLVKTVSFLIFSTPRVTIIVWKTASSLYCFGHVLLLGSFKNKQSCFHNCFQMLKQPSGPNWFKFLKKSAVALFVLEGSCFVGSYLFWHRLNTNRGKKKVATVKINFVLIDFHCSLLHSLDFRYYFHVNYPTVLTYYYKVGEFCNRTASFMKKSMTSSFLTQQHWFLGEFFDDVHNVNRIKQTDLAVFEAKTAKQE